MRETRCPICDTPVDALIVRQTVPGEWLYRVKVHIVEYRLAGTREIHWIDGQPHPALQLAPRSPQRLADAVPALDAAGPPDPPPPPDEEPPHPAAARSHPRPIPPTTADVPLVDRYAGGLDG